MSFSDKEALTGEQKFGCLIYSVAGVIVAGFGMIASGFGDCLSGPAGAACEYRKLALYPGILIIVFLGGVFLLRKFLRENQ